MLVLPHNKPTAWASAPVEDPVSATAAVNGSVEDGENYDDLFEVMIDCSQVQQEIPTAGHAALDSMASLLDEAAAMSPELSTMDSLNASPRVIDDLLAPSMSAESMPLMENVENAEWMMSSMFSGSEYSTWTAATEVRPQPPTPSYSPLAELRRIEEQEVQQHQVAQPSHDQPVVIRGGFNNMYQDFELYPSQACQKRQRRESTASSQGSSKRRCTPTPPAAPLLPFLDTPAEYMVPLFDQQKPYTPISPCLPHYDIQLSISNAAAEPLWAATPRQLLSPPTGPQPEIDLDELFTPEELGQEVPGTVYTQEQLHGNEFTAADLRTYTTHRQVMPAPAPLTPESIAMATPLTPATSMATPPSTGASPPPFAAPARIHCDHPGCKASYSRPCDYNKHKKTHVKPVACREGGCGAAFPTVKDRDRHELSKHRTELHLKCCACDHRTARKDNMMDHMKRRHAEVDLKSAMEGIMADQKKKLEAAAAQRGARRKNDDDEEGFPM